MDSGKLRRAVVLAQYLNFTRAADALNITQSALSRSIQSLEAECQLRLFDRNRSSVAVTAVGREFLRRAQSMLRSEAELRAMIESSARGAGGTIALGLSPLLSGTILAPLVAAFLDQPDFHARVTIDAPRELLAMVSDETLELCVCRRMTRGGLALFVETPVARVGMAMVVRPDHPLLQLREVSPSHVLAFPRVQSRPAEDQYGDPGGFWAGAEPNVTIEDYRALRQIAETTDAVWVTTRLAARDALSSGKLVCVPDSRLPNLPTLDLAAYYLSRRTLSPLAERLLDRLIILGREVSDGSTPDRSDRG